MRHSSHRDFGLIRQQPALPQRRATTLQRWRWPGFLACALALQALLLATPGYLSHDELQWGAFASVPWRELPFVSFLDWKTFQFRPLTFNAWLLLSHALFDSPRLFHALFALLGAVNGVLLAITLRRAGSRDGVAFVAGLVFVASPFAAWVHGWVGCLGDLLWVGFALALAIALQGAVSEARAFVIAALCTALGLLAKEAALSIPALLVLSAWLRRGPRAGWFAALGSGAIALAYLGLRLPVLLQADPDSYYALQPWGAPLRGFEYFVFPWALNVDEAGVLALRPPSQRLVFALPALLLLALLWQAAPKLAFAWIAGGVMALAPVLPLPASANQYGYGFAALTCGLAALAWPRLQRRGRIALVTLALIAAVHGWQIQRNVWMTGQLQSVFTPSLAQAAQAQPAGAIRLWPMDAGQRPIYQRLSERIPSWRGIALGERIGMARQRDEATHLVAPDGVVREVASP